MLSRRLALCFAALSFAFAGCNCGSSSQTDAGAQCTAADDCPAPQAECRQASCVNGVCGVSPVASGTPVSTQTAGDCQVSQCDGVGNVISVEDATDVEDDGNDCTVDSCLQGAPTHGNADAGVGCGADGGLVCNGGGACVGCVMGADCAGQDTDCRTRVCNAGTCDVSLQPQGTPTATQTPGDCQENQCTAQGDVVAVARAADVPDDDNACTDDVCTGMTPSNPPTAAGTACADGGIVCDGAGACVACNQPTDCPGQDTTCRARACVAHACGSLDADAGTPLPTQTPGDCHREECDGAGASTNAVDDADVPTDANPCTAGVCTAGVPSQNNVAAGMPCGTNLVCDGAGQCVGCVTPADCAGTSSECLTITCTNNVCGATFAPTGTALAAQTAGDCLTAVCDGTGGVTSTNADADRPVDNLQCTQDVCTNGVPSNPPQPIDTPCTQSGGSRCNASGACVQCNQASHCPAATDCVSYACNSGLCGASYTPANTPTGGQVAGDCHALLCDGAGGVNNAVADADLPVDGLQCTDDVCTAGVPTNPPTATGTACTQGGTVCDGFGACVQCVAASDCTGPSGECETPTCVGNTCGRWTADAGTPLSTQTAGNCQTAVCDGDGGTGSTPTDSDVPVDGQQCTDDVCTTGVPSNPPLGSGATCSQSGGTVCDGAGACVECVSGAQCASLVCASNVCQPASCTDLVRNGAETDVDCGGSTCPPCAPTRNCAVGADCQTGVCTGAVCQSPSVVSTTPADGATGVAPATTVSATFSNAMNVATFSVQAAAGPCTGTVQLSADDFVTCLGLGGLTTTATSVTATPAPALARNTRYKLRVTSVAQDTFGNALTAYTSPTGFTTAFVPTASCGVVISQVYGGGGNSGAPWTNDFIELQNLGLAPASVAGWSVQYASATGSSWTRTNLPTVTLQPGQYLLVQQGSGGTNGVPLPAPDATGTTAMSGTAGKVALVPNVTTLSGVCPTGLIDFVGYGGTATCFEGAAPTATLGNAVAARRVGVDTNDNGLDFVAATPTPRNTVVPPAPCGLCGLRNETDLPEEADYAVLQFPPATTVAPSAVTELLFGRVFEAGVTPPAGPAPNVVAEVGFGPAGVDPTTQCGWQFVPATFNVQVGNDDEYQGTLTAPATPGSYRYTFRFSVDSGLTWTYGDLNGAGANAGLTFETAQLGVMTVP